MTQQPKQAKPEAQPKARKRKPAKNDALHQKKAIDAYLEFCKQEKQ